MKDSRLIDFLKTFSAEEFKDFEKFAASPYYNKGRDLTKFLNVLKKFYPDFTGKGIEKENIFKKLFPGEKYNDQTMRTLSSKLAKVCEAFLVVKNHERDKQEVDIHLIDEMQVRGLTKYTEKMLTDLENSLRLNKTSHDSNYYFKQSLFDQIMSQQYLRSDNPEGLKKHDEKAFFVNYLLTKMIGYLNEEFADRFNRNINDKNTLISIFSECLLGKRKFEDLIEFIKNDSEADTIPAEFFLSFSRLALGKPDFKDYLKIRNIFTGNIDKLSRISKYGMLVDLETAGVMVRQADNCPADMAKYQFEIYDLEFRHRLFGAKESDKMRSSFYKAAILAGMSVKNEEWLENFITEATPLLEKTSRDKMKNFALAHLSFLRKEYLQANEYVSIIHDISLSFKFDLKLLQLMIYFELGYNEEAFSMLDSFRHFLSNNKNVNEVRRSSLMNFINCYNNLLKCKVSDTKKSFGDIRIEMMKDYGSFRYKEWLLEKTDQQSSHLKAN